MVKNDLNKVNLGLVMIKSINNTFIIVIYQQNLFKFNSLTIKIDI